MSYCILVDVIMMLMSWPGVLGSMFSFLQYLTSPVIGAVSDVYGRKPIMILTSVINVSLTHSMLCLTSCGEGCVVTSDQGLQPEPLLLSLSFSVFAETIFSLHWPNRWFHEEFHQLYSHVWLIFTSHQQRGYMQLVLVTCTRCCMLWSACILLAFVLTVLYKFVLLFLQLQTSQSQERNPYQFSACNQTSKVKVCSNVRFLLLHSCKHCCISNKEAQLLQTVPHALAVDLCG